MISRENFIHSEVKDIALSLIGSTAVSKILTVLLKTTENERKGIPQPCKEEFIQHVTVYLSVTGSHGYYASICAILVTLELNRCRFHQNKDLRASREVR